MQTVSKSDDLSTEQKTLKQIIIGRLLYVSKMNKKRTPRSSFSYTKPRLRLICSIFQVPEAFIIPPSLLYTLSTISVSLTGVFHNTQASTGSHIVLLSLSLSHSGLPVARRFTNRINASRSREEFPSIPSWYPKIPSAKSISVLSVNPFPSFIAHLFLFISSAN